MRMAYRSICADISATRLIARELTVNGGTYPEYFSSLMPYPPLILLLFLDKNRSEPGMEFYARLTFSTLRVVRTFEMTLSSSRLLVTESLTEIS